MYPNAYHSSSLDTVSEPSIRGRELLIPLNAWFTMTSKMALPLVSLQYSEVKIEVTIRPIQDLFTISANLAGLPALSLPSGFVDNKPLGLQLIAPQLHDVNLLRYAQVYEKATNFTSKIPPLCDKEC